jgi:hypothetical protein
MNALPSFNPQEQFPQPPRKVPRRKSRVKSDRANAYRRQRAEALTKLATYSVLSVFGAVTLTNLVAYNCAQQAKFQYLQSELNDARARSEKIGGDFNRTFDPYSQANVAQENSFKISKDQLQVVMVNPSKSSAATKLGR